MQGAGVEKQDRHAAKEEDVPLLVVGPAEVLELQGKHGDFAHQQEAEEQHEDYVPVRENLDETAFCYPTLTTDEKG